MSSRPAKVDTAPSLAAGSQEWLFWPLRQSTTTSVLLGSTLIILIAITDRHSAEDVPLGFLYLLPMLIFGRVLRPWQTLLVACTCTFLTERFDPFVWSLRTGLPRDVLYDIAFSAIGLFVYHSNRNRQLILHQLGEIERLSQARLDAEQQLVALVQASPAAIVTTDLLGTILSANEAAHRLLASETTTLTEQQLTKYLPSMQWVMQQSRRRQNLRTVTQARGTRSDGETFVAEVCISTYETAAGPRFTAMILDSSDDFRSREETGLHQIMASARLAVSAMSHEIRNISGAIAAVHRNIEAKHLVSNDQDFEALGKLATALERMATLDLRSTPEHLCRVELQGLIEDLRIVVTPDLEEGSVHMTWTLETKLPAVLAEPGGLMQILLNLTSNSIRALVSQNGPRQLSISAHALHGSVIIEVVDNGGGIAERELLFRPFQAGAEKTGLGLYLSRAIARSFGGDLQYRAVPHGACFAITLEQAPA